MQAIKEHEEFRLVSNRSYLLRLMEARGHIDDPAAPTALAGSCSVMQFPICLRLLLCEFVLNLRRDSQSFGKCMWLKRNGFLNQTATSYSQRSFDLTPSL